MCTYEIFGLLYISGLSSINISFLFSIIIYFRCNIVASETILKIFELFLLLKKLYKINNSI